MDVLGRDLFTTFGEASGYFESCRSDSDRSWLHRAKLLKDFGRFFSQPSVGVFSLSYNVGHLQGLVTACSDANAQSIKERVSTATRDVREVLAEAVERPKVK